MDISPTSPEYPKLGTDVRILRVHPIQKLISSSILLTLGFGSLLPQLHRVWMQNDHTGIS